MFNSVATSASVLLMLMTFESARSGPIIQDDGKKVTSVETAKAATELSASVAAKVADKPHHLFVGRCKSDDQLLHGENVLVNNDGKSHVTASIRMNVGGPAQITCVKVWDHHPDGEGGYPSYLEGGVGRNFIAFLVETEHGKGFNFYVQIFGRPISSGNM